MPTSSIPSECPFCRSNGLLEGEVVAEIAQGFLLRAAHGSANYLIIPADHVESPDRLPDDWWQSFKRLLAMMPDMPVSYNISLNIGKNAGQSVKHLHFWIVSREDGQPSSGKGLARLISEANTPQGGDL